MTLSNDASLSGGPSINGAFVPSSLCMFFTFCLHTLEDRSTICSV